MIKFTLEVDDDDSDYAHQWLFDQLNGRLCDRLRFKLEILAGKYPTSCQKEHIAAIDENIAKLEKTIKSIKKYEST